MFNRRQFLQIAGAGAAGLLVNKTAYAFENSPHLAKFIQPLPGLGAAGIPVASPRRVGNADNYTIAMGQFQQSVHPALNPTTFWGYGDATHGAPVHRYLGPAIVAQRGTPVEIAYLNQLPNKHLLPVDRTLPGADNNAPENRAAPHLHGGFVPWTSDGGPLSWFTPGNAQTGVDFVSNVYHYPNDQSSRLMWYHDHAIGITRLNAYAGLAAPYILRDGFEDLLIQLGLLPSGPYEVPLVIQDKIFLSDGSLWYPSVYEHGQPGYSDRWAYGPEDKPPAKILHPTLPVPSCIPEFFGDTILVNGAAFPALTVQPRPYRFRILNGSQARFYNLQLYYAKTSAPTEPNLSKPGPAFFQIGNECGFLPNLVVLNAPPVPFSVKLDSSGQPISSTLKYNLLMAPAERADIIIDFSDVPPGSKLILYNDAPAPFPGGDPLNDYHQTGAGPDTRTLLQFTVGPQLLVPPAPFDSNALSNQLSANAAQSAAPGVVGGVSLGKTLNEDYDDYGRLIQRIGTVSSRSKNNQGLDTYGLNFDAPPTEVVQASSTQTWYVYNLTGDTHPMHFHLVNVSVLKRGTFTISPGGNFTPGVLRDPDPNERGYKETVRMNPGEVTEVMMRFDLPANPGPVSQRTGGYNYVWHCHILEHEEHDMMRPLIVKP